MWLAMLLAMLGNWAVRGTPIYPSMEAGQTIAYISDIGAEGLKPLFITGSVITVVFLDLSFVSERWLRHSGQLVPNRGWLDKFCAVASIFFAVAGALGLILLSCYDTLRHPNLHDGFLVMFIVGYLVSAVLICVEYLWLGIFYRSQHRILFASFLIKLAFVIIEVALAIAFGICTRRNSGKKNVAAVLEWVIAFVFTGYILSFVVDLLPSVRTRRHIPQGEKRLEMAHEGPNAPHPGHNGANGGGYTVEEPLTTDSAGPNANYYRGQRPTGY
ncbi:hypothetical protein CDV55_105007 [Aspergillus turcosus]|uniref:CWH43-like N-terminal domain-containing protein n=1 Tax=Aspergillus turcosus TaxID=1245748 RepID=A0A397I7N2_9EURO|nr:hypothetical protein CDV55_105007 [Aspergillus turcosus]RLL97253.1 hypothetical protein CFD26_106984 [Aspergillus turcosus]